MSDAVVEPPGASKPVEKVLSTSVAIKLGSPAGPPVKFLVFVR